MADVKFGVGLTFGGGWLSELLSFSVGALSDLVIRDVFIRVMRLWTGFGI